MRRLEVVFSDDITADCSFIAVALDVLRATTTILTALENGATAILPAIDKDEAIAFRQANLGAILAGERNSIRIDGFELGNSPLEYTREKVCRKKVILTTTNGTLLLRRLSGYHKVLIGSLRNSKAVANMVNATGKGIRIFCAGRRGRKCFEDNLAAGAIVSHLRQRDEFAINDKAEEVFALFQANVHSVAAAILDCEGGRRLIEKGFAEDVKFCSCIDVSSVVPMFDGEKIYIAA